MSTKLLGSGTVLETGVEVPLRISGWPGCAGLVNEYVNGISPRVVSKRNSKPPSDCPGAISVPVGGGPGNIDNASILVPGAEGFDVHPDGSDRINPDVGKSKTIS